MVKHGKPVEMLTDTEAMLSSIQDAWCIKKKTYIGKTVGNNITNFRRRINQNGLLYKFPHTFSCGNKNICLEKPFLKLKWHTSIKI